MIISRKIHSVAVFLEIEVQIIMDMVIALGILSLLVQLGKLALFWKLCVQVDWAKISWVSLMLYGVGL